jgi:hypothetical protein
MSCQKCDKSIPIVVVEALLATVIDLNYSRFKPGFADYKNKTHKLGWFKERIKKEFHDALREVSKKGGD